MEMIKRNDNGNKKRKKELQGGLNGEESESLFSGFSLNRRKVGLNMSSFLNWQHNENKNEMNEVVGWYLRVKSVEKGGKREECPGHTFSFLKKGLFSME